jgi:hypothetical protein
VKVGNHTVAQDTYQFLINEAIEWKRSEILGFLTQATASNHCPGLSLESRKDLKSRYKGFIVPFQ